jgi:hypothetical protein
MADFNPSKVSFAPYVKLTKKVLMNMSAKGQRKQFAGILLAGDPGVGKTTYINFLSKLLGIEVITVEAPHIVEEHIVNIPFLVFNPSTGQQRTGSTKVEVDNFKVVLADSNLFSQIAAAHAIPDEEYLKNIYKSSADIIGVFESFGGTKEKVPPAFHAVRSQYSVILFLDEYFRQTSTRIRNILRGILNGRIGRHEIPPHAYIIYATNLHDQGVEDIPTNAQFDVVKMDRPNKEQWFSWLVYKFENDKHVKLNKEVINEFYKILDEEDLSKDDPESEVRTSPRRWEQLLLLINESLPVKDEKEARALLTNVKTNFRNYLTGQHSALAEKVLKAVQKLIKKTSDLEISGGTGSHEWRDTLKHQIEIKMRLGEHRKYVPVLAGLPGIGKTAQAEQVANELNLRFIDIDVSQLNAEDVIGLPIPDQRGDKIKTSFSAPGLYQMIMEKIKEEDAAYMARLESEPDGAKKVKEYKGARWKYLVFFDELNRNDTKVFNAIRRVLLEKNFGPSNDGRGKLLELPKETIIVAAINPHDVGAQELSSHMRDVLDIIHATSSWKDTLAYLQHQKVKGVDDGTHDLFLNVLQKFVEKFKTRDPNVEMEERPFHLELGGDVYISPREYTQLFINGVMRLHDKLEEIHALDLQSMKAEELQEVERDIREAIFEAFEDTLEMPFIKHNVESTEFMHDLKNWIMHSHDIDIGENVFYRKGAGVHKSLKDIIGEHLDAAAKTTAAENQDFINFLNNTDLTQFREGLGETLEEKITDKKTANKYILEPNYPKKELKDDMIVENPSEKVTLVENFLLELVYALHLNGFSYDKIYAVYKGATAGIQAFLAKNVENLDRDLADQIQNSAVHIIAKIVKVIKGLK